MESLQAIQVAGDMATIEARIPEAVELAGRMPKPAEDMRFAGVPALVGTLPTGVTITLATYPADDALLVAIRIPKGRFMEADYVSSTIEHPATLARPGILAMLVQEAHAGWESAIIARARY